MDGCKIDMNMWLSKPKNCHNSEFTLNVQNCCLFQKPKPKVKRSFDKFLIAFKIAKDYCRKRAIFDKITENIWEKNKIS